ncbi:MAG TPA: PHP domain-containing protein [Kofleriaceae bacterium]|nr:PHP domain-containing protein [Kofleriaceae bacterium]
MHAVEIAACLRELAVYMRLERDSDRARAYERAARTVEAVHDLDRRVAEGTLLGLPGIGTSIARVVTELARTGRLDTLDRLRKLWPATLVELSRLPDVGTRRARILVEQLSPRDLDELLEMAKQGRVRELPGFGKSTESKLITSLETRHERGTRRLLQDARRVTSTLVEYLRLAPEAVQVHAAGEARRWIEIVDEIVVVVATEQPAAIRAHVAHHPLVVEVADGETAGIAVAHLSDGGLARIHLAPPALLGATQIIATGSPMHVSMLRQRAAAAGKQLETIEGLEGVVYAALGLPWIPPEVRDGDDEITRGAAGERFDDLVTIADVTGAVHCHTTYSDGKHSIAQMAHAAEERGLSFLTITDHSHAAHYAGGLDDGRLREQWKEIESAQAGTSVRLVRGTESDILVDGSLDFSHETLTALEIVIASVHNRHKLDEDAMTQRLVTAMRQPLFKIWGHALGRLVLRREPFACRFDDVLDAIVESPAAIEINGDPHRLDLDPARVRKAHARGVRFVLSSDAHSTDNLDYLENAVAMARRARLRPADILNTLPPDEFLEAVRPVR